MTHVLWYAFLLKGAATFTWSKSVVCGTTKLIFFENLLNVVKWFFHQWNSCLIIILSNIFSLNSLVTFKSVQNKYCTKRSKVFQISSRYLVVKIKHPYLGNSKTETTFSIKSWACKWQGVFVYQFLLFCMSFHITLNAF